MSPNELQGVMMQWRFAMADRDRAVAKPGPKKKPKPKEGGSHGQ